MRRGHGVLMVFNCSHQISGGGYYGLKHSGYDPKVRVERRLLSFIMFAEFVRTKREPVKLFAPTKAIHLRPFILKGDVECFRLNQKLSLFWGFKMVLMVAGWI